MLDTGNSLPLPRRVRPDRSGRCRRSVAQPLCWPKMFIRPRSVCNHLVLCYNHGPQTVTGKAGYELLSLCRPTISSSARSSCSSSSSWAHNAWRGALCCDQESHRCLGCPAVAQCNTFRRRTAIPHPRQRLQVQLFFRTGRSEDRGIADAVSSSALSQP
jgi:hypothetical protein